MDALSRKRKILECSVCKEWLTPPVITCYNGHGTCQKCRNSMTSCGICQADFSKIKNTLLNEVIKTALIRCSNNSLGCKKCCTVAEMKDHKKECCYRKVTCCICVENNIYIYDLNNHFAEKHANKKSPSVSVMSSTHTYILMKGKKLRDDQVLWYIFYDKDVNIHFLARFLKDKDNFYVCVNFLGKIQEEAKNYMYEVKIDQQLQPPNEKCFFTCSALCTPYNYNFVENLSNERVIRLNLKTIFFNYEDYKKEFKVGVKIRKLE